MEVTPSLVATRFEKLAPGDLFIYGHEHGLSVAMVVLNPIDEDNYILPLGPTFPPNIPSPTAYLSRQKIFALSFGAQYRLQLPSSVDGWTSTEPALGSHFLVAEEGVFLRANLARPGSDFHPCYVNIKDGRILATTREFQKPSGQRAYALSWEILTTEKPPRAILSYPF